MENIKENIISVLNHIKENFDLVKKDVYSIYREETGIYPKDIISIWTLDTKIMGHDIYYQVKEFSDRCGGNEEDEYHLLFDNKILFNTLGITNTDIPFDIIDDFCNYCDKLCGHI